jgi:hypothetical protein
MSETLRGGGAWIRGVVLVPSLLALTFAVLAAGMLYEEKRKMREDRAAHERCRAQATDIVEAAACTCILKREGGLFQHALAMSAPRAWQELWRQATRNECMAEAYTGMVTERGIQVIRPLPLPGTEGGFSP